MVFASVIVQECALVKEELLVRSAPLVPRECLGCPKSIRKVAPSVSASGEPMTVSSLPTPGLR